LNGEPPSVVSSLADEGAAVAAVSRHSSFEERIRAARAQAASTKALLDEYNAHGRSPPDSADQDMSSEEGAWGAILEDGAAIAARRPVLPSVRKVDDGFTEEGVGVSSLLSEGSAVDELQQMVGLSFMEVSASGEPAPLPEQAVKTTSAENPIDFVHQSTQKSMGLTYGDVAVGTPSHSFHLIMDTGSYGPVLKTFETAENSQQATVNAGVKGTKVEVTCDGCYDHARSSSFRTLGQKSSVVYGSGPALLSLGTDTFRVPLTAPSAPASLLDRQFKDHSLALEQGPAEMLELGEVPMSEITAAKIALLSNVQVDGILGLAHGVHAPQVQATLLAQYNVAMAKLAAMKALFRAQILTKLAQSKQQQAEAALKGQGEEEENNADAADQATIAKLNEKLAVGVAKQSLVKERQRAAALRRQEKEEAERQLTATEAELGQGLVRPEIAMHALGETSTLQDDVMAIAMRYPEAATPSDALKMALDEEEADSLVETLRLSPEARLMDDVVRRTLTLLAKARGEGQSVDAALDVALKEAASEHVSLSRDRLVADEDPFEANQGSAHPSAQAASPHKEKPDAKLPKQVEAQLARVAQNNFFANHLLKSGKVSAIRFCSSSNGGDDGQVSFIKNEKSASLMQREKGENQWTRTTSEVAIPAAMHWGAEVLDLRIVPKDAGKPEVVTVAARPSGGDGKQLLAAGFPLLQTSDAPAENPAIEMAKEVLMKALGVSGKIPDNVCDKGCAGMIDTGTNTLSGPSWAARALVQKLKIAPDCSNLASLPDLQLTLRLAGDGTKAKQFRLKPSSYVVRVTIDPKEAEDEDDDYSDNGPSKGELREMMISDLLAVHTHLTRNDLIDPKTGESKEACLAAISPGQDSKTQMGELWILGYPLLKHVAADFNLKDEPTVTIYEDKSEVCANGGASLEEEGTLLPEMLDQRNLESLVRSTPYIGAIV
jgi:hypothetical protein